MISEVEPNMLTEICLDNLEIKSICYDSNRFKNQSLSESIAIPRVYYHWLGLAADETCPLCDYARMDTTTCSTALDLMNTLLTTSSVGTGWFGVKWSRSQARALDK
ncbi:hypothetical protein TNCV_1840241 [Trichonephila clavipes]|nr:hypothetical protein TNCV_1840241 [Trichonephila clavipes]